MKVLICHFFLIWIWTFIKVQWKDFECQDSVVFRTSNSFFEILTQFRNLDTINDREVCKSDGMIDKLIVVATEEDETRSRPRPTQLSHWAYLGDPSRSFWQDLG